MKRAGYLIAIYGINNIGKSTQVDKLVDFFKKNKWSSEKVKYPVYRQKPTGPYINALLRGGKKQSISEEEFQMWYTLNRYQYEPTLLKKISKGEIIIAEDYIATGLAWGATKGADLDWLTEMNKHLRKEDLVILLDGERFISGKEKQHIHEGRDDYMKLCRRWYQNLAKMNQWPIVNANQSIQQVHEDILEIVSVFMRQHKTWQ
jgi:thymidylate kinase